MDEYFLFSNITSTMWSKAGTDAATGVTAVGVSVCVPTTAAAMPAAAMVATAIRLTNMEPSRDSSGGGCLARI